MARASLDPAFRLERFDGLPVPGVPAAGQAAPTDGLRRFALDEGVGERVVAAALQGHSLWWTEGAPAVEPSMLLCAGLPQAQGFAAMLDGAWR